MCKILDVLGLNWKRNLIGFPYITKTGQRRKFYPDFYVETYDKFIETKGYLTPESIHKMNAAKIPNLIIIKTNRFGGNWDEIQKDNNMLLEKLKNTESVNSLC